MTDADDGTANRAARGVDTGLDVVTGAFSFSGASIAAALRARGRVVRTLTGHPERVPPQAPITAFHLSFTDRGALTRAMRGATTLYNTYWIRFAHGATDHDVAVSNSRTLFDAAAQAGIQRIVHISITNPSPDSPLPYFRGKARVEQYLESSGISYAILRPAILFGGNDVLVNNMAWLLRRLPVFAVGGDEQYRIRGIHVDDLAALCVAYGSARTNATIDAVGPDRPTFLELTKAIRNAVGSHAQLVRVPGAFVPPLARLLSLPLRDVLLTSDEYRAMAAGLADTAAPTTGTISILAWLADTGDHLGRRYANELNRHFAAQKSEEHPS